MPRGAVRRAHGTGYLPNSSARCRSAERGLVARTNGIGLLVAIENVSCDFGLLSTLLVHYLGFTRSSRSGFRIPIFSVSSTLAYAAAHTLCESAAGTAGSCRSNRLPPSVKKPQDSSGNSTA